MSTVGKFLETKHGLKGITHLIRCQLHCSKVDCAISSTNPTAKAAQFSETRD